MAHRSMYETIMELPLFKGASTEDISSFLEKTKIEFKNYKAGDVIITEDEPVKVLKFMISGKAEVTASICGGEARVVTETEEMVAFGVSGLFGLTPHYVVSAKAKNKVSLMEFSKDSFIELLKINNIFLLNYANFLSHRVQKHENLIRSAKGTGALDALRAIVSAFSTRKCESIYLEFKNEESLLKYFPWKGRNDLLELEEKGLISLDGSRIKIISRQYLLS